MKGAVQGAVVLIVAVPVVLMLLLMLVVVPISSEGSTDAVCGTPAAAGHILPSGARLTSRMLENAEIVVSVADRLEAPDRAALIALTAALVEAQLVNAEGGDRDSVGIFQQRPSQGWGSREEIMDPVYASTRFYEALLDVPNWQSMHPGSAAQAVQRSAYPRRYGRRIEDAATILATVARTGTEYCTINSAQSLAAIDSPSGMTITVAASIAPDLRRLLDAAEADGIILGGWGHRSTERQIELRRRNCGPTDYAIYEMPPDRCHPDTATPGTSLHESGLAVDFTCNGTTESVRRGDPCDIWLADNAHRYGLHVLSTGTEPWHYSTTGD